MNMNLYVFSSKPENGMKAGEAEAFVVQYPGDKHAAEAWVQSQAQDRFHGREFICTPLPLNKDKPVVLCHHVAPVSLEPESLDLSDEDESDDMF